MVVNKEDKETYLYINGIKVSHAITLDEGLTLLPVASEFDFESASKLIKSDVDYSIVVLSANSLYSQIRVAANSVEELVIKAWNAQWDCALLSAILNTNIISNIQCDKKVECLKEATNINITNYRLYGLNGSFKELSSEDESWIEKNYANAKLLLDNKQFETAIHCMSSYTWHSLPRVQIAILWSGIESLFNVSTELSFRIGLHIALFLSADNKDEAEKIFNNVRKLYNIRSSAVHGNKIKEDLTEYVSQSSELLNKLIRRCAEIGNIPNPKELIF